MTFLSNKNPLIDQDSHQFVVLDKGEHVNILTRKKIRITMTNCFNKTISNPTIREVNRL